MLARRVLDEVVHTRVDACPHARCLGIHHSFQDTHAPIEPAVALLLLFASKMAWSSCLPVSSSKKVRPCIVNIIWAPSSVRMTPWVSGNTAPSLRRCGETLHNRVFIRSHRFLSSHGFPAAGKRFSHLDGPMWWSTSSHSARLADCLSTAGHPQHLVMRMRDQN